MDEPSLARLIDSVRPQVSALIPTLSSGEGWLLSEAQWRAAVSGTVRAAGPLPVLAGVQRPDTAGVVAGARLANQLGAAAVVVGPPSGDISQREVQEHYRTVVEAGIPVVVYNEAAISGVEMTLETLRAVCQLPGIVGVKESSGSAEFTTQLAHQVDVPVFEGWENLLHEVKGVAGFIGPLANLEPKKCADLWEHPSLTRQAEVNELCEKYGVFTTDWYKWVKTELVRRQIIDHATSVEEARA